MAVGSTGISPSRGSLMTAPPLPATASRSKCRLSRSDCGWTGVSLALLPVVAGAEPPARDSRLYIAPRNADCGAAANGSCFRNGNRNVLDEWVFGCQRPSLLAEKENRQRVFVPLHLFPHLKAIFQPPIPKKFFQSFFGGRNRFCNGLKSASLHSCDLLIGQALKIVEDQPPLLYFGQFGDRSM